MFRLFHKKYPVRVGIDSTGSLLTIVVRLKRMGKNKFYFFSYEIPEPEEKLSYLPESVEDFLQQFDLTNIGVTIGLPFFKSTLGFLDVPKILRRKELHSYMKDKIELQLKDNLDD